MFTQTIAKVLTQVTGLSAENVTELLEVPPTPELGDYAFPCFSLAKQKKKAPPEIAKELAGKIRLDGLIARVTATGPYVNFFLSRSAIVAAAFEETTRPAMHKTVVIEFSSPNIAKPFGIGHLRSTVIGAALARTYEYAGWNVVRLNHPGDWGTQFGNLIAAYDLWHDRLKGDTLEGMYTLYVSFHEEAEKDPDLAKKGREEFKKLEQGDKKNRALWEKFRKISLEEFDRIYKRLGVQFDYTHGESFYEDKIDGVVKDLKKKNLLEESEGAKIVQLEDAGIETPALILKDDGSTLYLTRDLAAAIYRKKEFSFDKMLYEVGNEQTLHFKQLFAVLFKLGHEWASTCEHISHGLYVSREGKLSTRKGNTIFVEDVFDEAVERCKKMVEEKNPTLAEKETVSEMVGVGAIIFNDLKTDRNNDVLFDWEKILDLEGESGPYLQYTHARLKSILRKSNEKPVADPALLGESEEVIIAKKLLFFPEVIKKVIDNNKPHTLARHALDLAQLTNTYYQKHKVIQDDKKLEAARLSLIEAVATNIKLSLSLLGIQAPEEM